MQESLPNMSKERPIGPKTPSSKRVFPVGVKRNEKPWNYSVRGTTQGDLGGSIGKYHPSNAKYWYCLLIPPPHLGSHAMAISLSLAQDMAWEGRRKTPHVLILKISSRLGKSIRSSILSYI